MDKKETNNNDFAWHLINIQFKLFSNFFDDRCISFVCYYYYDFRYIAILSTIAFN